MTRACRRQNTLAMPSPTFNRRGQCRSLAGLSRLPGGGWPALRTMALAAEVRNGVRWPWLDPRLAVRALRGRQPPVKTAFGTVYYSGVCADRWAAAVDLTPRERAELLAYLTRGYL